MATSHLIETLKMRIENMRGKHHKNIYQKEFLYVPSWIRTLFSFPQWTDSGGECTIGAPNSKQGFFSVRNTLFNTWNGPTYFLVPTTALWPHKKKKNILYLTKDLVIEVYKPLKQQSNLTFGQDSTFKLNSEDFCWDCKIAFSRKANQGKSCLNSDPDLKAGEYLTVDIWYNPRKFGLTKTTTYSNPYKPLMLYQGSQCYWPWIQPVAADRFEALLHLLSGLSPELYLYGESQASSYKQIQELHLLPMSLFWTLQTWYKDIFTAPGLHKIALLEEHGE